MANQLLINSALLNATATPAMATMTISSAHSGLAAATSTATSRAYALANYPALLTLAQTAGQQPYHAAPIPSASHYAPASLQLPLPTAAPQPPVAPQPPALPSIRLPNLAAAAAPSTASPSTASPPLATLYADHILATTPPCEVSIDYKCLPAAVLLYILNNTFDFRLLLTANLGKLISTATREDVEKLLKEILRDATEISEQDWWLVFSLFKLTHSVFSTPERAFITHRLAAFDLHMRLKGMALPDWRQYYLEFFEVHPLLSEAPEPSQAWVQATNTTLFRRYSNSSAAPADAPRPPKAPRTGRRGDKSLPCFRWNKHECEEPAASCAYGHFCEICRIPTAVHRRQHCPARRSGSDEDTGRKPARKRPANRCDSPLSYYPLPAPLAVCSFNVQNIFLSSDFLGSSELRAYVLSGLTNGFCLSFDDGPLSSTYTNSPSALSNPTVVEEMLAKEVSLGSMAGPFPVPPLPNLQVSRFSLKEKPNNSGWRFLFDLSYPEDLSVNDGIPREAAAVSYVKVSDICNKILAIGRGALLSKFPVPIVTSQSAPLIGGYWASCGKVFITLTSLSPSAAAPAATYSTQ